MRVVLGLIVMAVSTTDGKETFKTKLTAPPVYDGMIAANGRLYIVGTDGRINCFGAK